jgi:tRNA pseudouridine38-40 synthase
MVRILMGTLLEVGAGKRTPEDIQGILESKNRSMAGALVPAKGLTLVEVRY